jgi:hypothetical protein
MNFEFCPEVLLANELLCEFISFGSPRQLDLWRVSEGRNRCALENFR